MVIIKKLYHIIRIVDSVRKIIITDNKVLTVPTKLPMITKPKPYTLEENGNVSLGLGGYLNNDIVFTIGLFIDKIGYKYTTKIMVKNNIINLINGVSSVPYKINTETLQFITLIGISKGIVEDINNRDVKDFNLNPYKKIPNKINNNLRSKLSVIQLENYILNIAEAYKSVANIYFPVRLDQRTRLYCLTDLYNYQSNDLAKSWLSFSNCATIYKHDTEAINYLKSYGGWLFDSNMTRKSINTRVKWTDTNKDYILGFENNDIVDKADEKACFLSFCFQYKRLIEFMDNLEATEFKTNLPIQLDASCNGYQHICLLTKEKALFK